MHPSLILQDLGWNVMPLHGKRPIGEWGMLQRRMADRDKLVNWYDTHQGNVAIICGEISGVSVVDVDVKGGFDVKAFRQFYEKYPTPIVVRTGTGGYHLYYRFTKVKNAVRVKYPGLQIDVRSQGGYVVAPPSIHPDTGEIYRFVDIKNPNNEMDFEMIAGLRENLPPFPEEIAVQCRADASKVPDDWRAIVYATNEGSRNANAASICGKLISAFPTRDWYPLVWPLLRAWNKEYVVPALDDDELRVVFESISKSSLRSKRWDDDPSAVEIGVTDPKDTM